MYVAGAILAKSKTVFFRHNNPMDLERKLNRVRGKKLVVVEGVYSMDGDVCVLPEIVDVAKRNGARVLIDEAHSTFLFGPNGRGVAEHFGLDSEVDFHLGTFSKSLGGQGGFVCGTRELIDYVTGAALLVAGGSVLLNRRTRTVAASVGGWLLLLVLVIYGPVMVLALADPGVGVQVEGINYFADTLLFAGVILALAKES